MSTLTKRDEVELCKLLGSKKKFNLLFNATRDGCSGRVFHQKCDLKGPTVTVCYNTTGYVFGGYTSVDWNGALGAYSEDKQAFLFRLKASGKYSTNKYQCSQPVQAIYNQLNYGPTFGAGYDLHLFTNTVDKTGSYFQMGGTYALGTSYNLNGEANSHTALDGSDRNFTEIEVYQVSDRVLLEHPWRKTAAYGSPKVLLSSIATYSPPEGSKVKAINLLLLGPVGAGKSSFFNSVDSLFKGEVTGVARAGSVERSLTTTFRRYRTRSAETGETVKIRFCDTRGLECEGGIDIVDLMAVVEGHVPDRFQFNPTIPINSDSTGYNASPTGDDRIHCIALIVDGTTVDVFPEKILNTIKLLQTRVNAKGIPQVVILTKVDKVCPEVQEDVGNIYNSQTIGTLVEQAAQIFGLPRSYVFPVKNYEEEVEVNEKVDVPILICLKQILRYAQDHIDDALASDKFSDENRLIQ